MERPLTVILPDEELKTAEERLSAFCGAVSSGDPHSCDNEKIDLDLALAYGDDHTSLYKPKSKASNRLDQFAKTQQRAS